MLKIIVRCDNELLEWEERRMWLPLVEPLDGYSSLCEAIRNSEWDIAASLLPGMNMQRAAMTALKDSDEQIPIYLLTHATGYDLQGILEQAVLLGKSEIIERIIAEIRGSVRT